MTQRYSRHIADHDQHLALLILVWCGILIGLSGAGVLDSPRDVAAGTVLMPRIRGIWKVRMAARALLCEAARCEIIIS